MSHALSTQDDSPAPPGWVPVERRWLGLDRRSLLPALVIATVGLLFGGLLPLVDDAVGWDNPVSPGDRVALGGVAITTPPPGWQLLSGVRVGEDTVGPAGGGATLFADGVTMSLSLAPLPDGPDAALDLLTGDLAGFHPEGSAVVGDRRAVSTDGGLPGVVEQWTTAAESGLLAVVALPAGDGPPVGVVVSAKGAGTALEARRGDVDSTIAGVAARAAR